SVIRVNRTDKTTHRLTLDGMSKYNTNDTSPSWVDYTGTSKMRLTMTGGCCISIGWDDDVMRDYVTIRVFEVTGSGGRIRWGGSYSVLENMWVHDVTSLGATVQFNQAIGESGYGCPVIGNAHDITVRNNLIQKGIGEGLYMAGNYNYSGDGGCTQYGDKHYDLLIEGNKIDQSGYYGKQGDAIDVKAGIYNVKIRGKTLKNMYQPGADPTLCQGGDGITTLGQMPLSTHESNYLIENNIIHNGNCVKSGSSDSSNGMSIGALHGATIRNNIIYAMPGNGLVL